MDRGGRPTVVFADARRQRLYLARRSGGEWDVQPIHASTGLGGQAGEALDLAIDAHDKCHVAHASLRAYQGIQLEYLTDRYGDWQLTRPGEPRAFGYDARVAVDPAGNVMLACRSSRPDNDLCLVSQKGPDWPVLEVETAGHVGFWIDLAIGQSYVPAATDPDAGTGSARRYKPFIAHAAYNRSQEKGAGPPQAVHLSYVDPKGRWSNETVPVSGPAGYGLALALSQWEEPHLSFGGGGRLYHAEKIATPTEGAHARWHVETVDDASAAVAGSPEDNAHADALLGWYTDIVLGEGDQPWIAYTAPQGLRVAHRERGRWSVETVVAGRGQGRACKLARDPWGGLHLTFYDPVHQRIRYAYGRP